MKKFLPIFFVILCFTGSLAAQESQKEGKKKQFVYVLKLIPRLLDETAWTKHDEEAISKHFRKLQKLHKEGTVLFAGRTLNTDSSQFGMVVFEATSEKEAETLMQEDDAVKAGIMKAQLFPFAVALK
ncbi:MAG: hypothetical protein H9535_07935 [Ignavibacteria bacterium]|nr:hypothetical protein [Ignavibacteria bacterium]